MRGRRTNLRVCRFFAEATLLLPAIARMAHRMSTTALLDTLLGRDKLLPVFATYVADIFDLCHDEPVLVFETEDDFLALAQ